MDIPRFSWERRIGLTVSTFVTGPAIFPRVTAKRVCLGARSPTHFFPVSKRRAIWCERVAHHLLIRIWPLFFEVAPAFRKLERSTDSSGLLLTASSAAAPWLNGRQVQQRNALAFRNGGP